MMVGQASTGLDTSSPGSLMSWHGNIMCSLYVTTYKVGYLYESTKSKIVSPLFILSLQCRMTQEMQRINLYNWNSIMLLEHVWQHHSLLYLYYLSFPISHCSFEIDLYFRFAFCTLVLLFSFPMMPVYYSQLTILASTFLFNTFLQLIIDGSFGI